MQLALDPAECTAVFGGACTEWGARHACARDERHAGPHRCYCGKQGRTPKKKSRPKKPTRTQLKKRADQIFRDKVRSRGYCQAAAGWPHSCGGHLETCHIEGRSNHRLRWEESNALAMCSGAHRWFTSHPAAWWFFVEENFPENVAYIRAHINEKWDRDIEAVIERLQA